MEEREELEYEIDIMYDVIDVLLDRMGMTFDEYMDHDCQDSDECSQILVMLVQVNKMVDRLEKMDQH